MIDAATEYEMVIGLEVHVQLSTESKIFCRCPSRVKAGQSVADLLPNQNTCPVCTAQPGALPVMNKKAVEYAVRAGLGTGCTVNLESVFARKNYFYPDSPKGYQISQFDRPICQNGHLDIQVGNEARKRITIQRIHLEEDAGKNLHGDECSLVNLNRAGTPLVEVVSAPELRSAEEAGAYLRELYSIVTFLDICDGNLQEGNFRCDANVSVRKKGSDKLGTRVEIKNVNSFRFVEKAIDYEAARQAEAIRSGEVIVQETRMFDAQKGATFSMRSKEEAHDYRYFPDPDLLTLEVTQRWLNEIQRTLPVLPQQLRLTWVQEYGLSDYDTGVLSSSKEWASFFTAVLQGVQDSKKIAKTVCNLLTGEVARILNDTGRSLRELSLKPEQLRTLAEMISAGTLSSSSAKKVITEISSNPEIEVQKYIDQNGLQQSNDLGVFDATIDEVLARLPSQVAEFKSGKDKVLGFIMGQIMKELKGKANPGQLQDVVKAKLLK